MNKSIMSGAKRNARNRFAASAHSVIKPTSSVFFTGEKENQIPNISVTDQAISDKERLKKEYHGVLESHENIRNYFPTTCNFVFSLGEKFFSIL